MTLSQAWETVYTLLEANNFTIITLNGINTVVPMAEHQQNVLPCFSSAQGVEPEQLEDSAKIVRYIYFCRNIKASVAEGILRPLLADKSVQINNILEACIITDKANSIKSAMKIIKELDTSGLRQEIRIKPLKHTNAEHVTRLFNEHIIQQEQQTGRIRVISAETKHDPAFFSKNTKVIPEPVHNKLIVMGTSDAIDRVISFVDKYLDVPMQTAKSRLHIKDLKYIASEKIKPILTNIIQPPRGTASDGTYRPFEDVAITAETPHNDKDDGQGRGFGNRLIISCSDEDWGRLNSFIDQLDKPQPQVACEVMIVDVNNDDARSLGAELRSRDNVLGKQISANAFMMPSKTRSTTETNLIKSQETDATSAPANQSILSFGDASKDDVWALIRAAYKIDHTNIISQPYLVINNNSTGEESVADTRKVAGKLESSSSTGSSLYRKTETVKAEVKTIITPRINASGIIELNVTINVGEFKENPVSQADQTTRTIITRATMAAGEVLVLGGLTSSKHDNKRWKVPILGDLPLVGNLFRDRSKGYVKKNLYVFIRPTVLKPHFGLGADEYTQLKLDYAKYQILGHDDYATNKDPIQRYFFSPRRYGVKNKLRDLAENRMPIIDRFAERRFIPNEVQIGKDPYFRSNQTHEDHSVELSYEPTVGNITMPHIQPSTYIAPGLIEESMPEDILSEIARQLEAEQ
jgi:general secretion pathway protein D